MPNNIKINSPLGNPAPQKKGSGFVNLNKILQANAGNRLGETVASGLGQGAQQVQQGLGQAKNQFIQESTDKNLASTGNTQAVSDALRNISLGQTDVSDDQAKQFGTFLAGQYTGPKELDAAKTVQLGSKAQEIQGLGQSLSGGADKTRLLQSFAGKGPYTAGQTRLDSLLLGQGPNAKQQLAEARQQTRGLTQQIGKEEDIARQIGQLRTGEAQQFGKDVRGQFGIDEAGNVLEGQGVLGKEQQAIQDRAAQYQKIQNIALRQLTGQPVSQEEQAILQQSGANLSRGNIPTATYDTYGVQNTGAKYYTPQQAATVSSAASPEERARVEALYKLIGKPQEFLQQASAYDPTKPVSFNEQQYLGDIGAAKQQYGEQNQQLGSEIDFLKKQMANIEGTPEYKAAHPNKGLNIGNKQQIQAQFDKIYEAEKAQYELRKKYGQTGAGHYVPVRRKA